MIVDVFCSLFCSLSMNTDSQDKAQISLSCCYYGTLEHAISPKKRVFHNSNPSFSAKNRPDRVCFFDDLWQVNSRAVPPPSDPSASCRRRNRAPFYRIAATCPACGTACCAGRARRRATGTPPWTACPRSAPGSRRPNIPPARA